jgi:DNA-directed RNA polymerase I subunit RPA2
VHTPDGEPCGLLNHIASECRVVATNEDVDDSLYLDVLARLGVSWGYSKTPVLLNGRLVGYVDNPDEVANDLRLLKLRKEIPKRTEVAVLHGFKILFVATEASRLMRPVKHLGTGSTIHIGPIEQLGLSIA